MRVAFLTLALALGCTAAKPDLQPGSELSLSPLPLRIAPPAGWIATPQTDGAVLLGTPEKMRYASWIRVGPPTETASDAAGWVEPLAEQQVRPDPDADQQITRLTGTFGAGRARYAVRAEVAYASQLPGVRASLATLRWEVR